MYAALLEFFTQEWSLSLKHLFDAEWGVFAALGFSLHVSPSQVTFHFKRLMKVSLFMTFVRILNRCRISSSHLMVPFLFALDIFRRWSGVLWII